MDLSIFIRTFNEEHFITRCLDAVLDQTRGLTKEILILDCGSTDRTVELAHSYPEVKVLQAPKNSFHYARALNFGVQRTTGKLFLSLSAHAIPANSQWLQELLKPLLEYEEIGMSYSRQIGWEGISTPESRAILRHFPDQDHTMTRELLGLRLSENRSPHDSVAFSNVSSIVRREIVEKFPFREIPFSEDRLLALEALDSGSAVYYASKSVVHHSHEPSFSAFRTIAYKSTVARKQIELRAARSFSFRHQNVRSELLKARIRLLVFLFFFPLVLLVALFFPYRINRLREVRFLIASIGTSLGKIDGLANLVHSNATEADVADCSELQNVAKETART